MISAIVFIACCLIVMGWLTYRIMQEDIKVNNTRKKSHKKSKKGKKWQKVTRVKDLREFINSLDNKYDDYLIIQGYDANFVYQDINIENYVIDDHYHRIKLLDGDYPDRR